MADAIQKAKLKNPYVDWKNRPYASGDDQKKKQAEAFEAMNAFVRKHGGSIVSPPGNKRLRIEIMRDSSAKLTDELTNEALPQTDEVYAEDGALIAIANDRWTPIKPAGTMP